jgi:hypothetical protein
MAHWLGIVATGATVALAASAESWSTAVLSKTAADYKRQRMPDGSFKREFYAISNGGPLPGTGHDHTIDQTMFPKIANVVGQALAKQNYHLARDANSAELLVVLFWGRTLVSGGVISHDATGPAKAASQQMNAINTQIRQEASRTGAGPTAEQTQLAGAANGDLASTLTEIALWNLLRDNANFETARKLGYTDEVAAVDDVARFGIRGDIYQQLISELEDPRYYIVVYAYDFKEATERKNMRPRWVTRTSISAHRKKFEEAMGALMASASRHLGLNSGRLVRGIEDGRVEIGEARVVDDASLNPNAPATGTKKEPVGQLEPHRLP